jgi:ATP-dependent RNA helicase DeaD
VGAIDVHDKYTFVEVPEEFAPTVLNAMKKQKLKVNPLILNPQTQNICYNGKKLKGADKMSGSSMENVSDTTWGESHGKE